MIYKLWNLNKCKWWDSLLFLLIVFVLRRNKVIKRFVIWGLFVVQRHKGVKKKKKPADWSSSDDQMQRALLNVLYKEWRGFVRVWSEERWNRSGRKVKQLRDFYSLSYCYSELNLFLLKYKIQKVQSNKMKFNELYDYKILKSMGW